MKEKDPRSWDKYYVMLGQLPERLRQPVAFVVEAVPLFKDHAVETVLDVGCGTGRNAVFLAKQGFRVVGIDTSKEALKMAKMWSKAEKAEDFDVVCASMTALPFLNGSFGAAVSISVIHHSVYADICKTMREILSVLRSGGVFLANLLSVEDYRFGSGRKIEDNTFRVMEDFEEGRFEEIHHFFTEEQALDLLAAFTRIDMTRLQAGEENRRHCFWKVTAIK